MAKIVTSEIFIRSPRMSRFLRLAVDKAATGLRNTPSQGRFSIGRPRSIRDSIRWYG
ncbi:MAG: hypothetical protein ACLGXA_16475 [Acidobacteriota bacterium]